MCERMHEKVKAGLLEALSRVPSDSALARQLGCKQPTIAKWRRMGRIPIERVPAVEQVTGVPRWQLRPDRPDMFPPPAAAAAAG